MSGNSRLIINSYNDDIDEFKKSLNLVVKLGVGK